MLDIARRLAWFFCVSCVSAYAIFLLLGSMIHAEAIDQSRIVQVRDALEPGAHHLSGIIMVRETCDELLVRTEDLSDTTRKLVFTTWPSPSVECESEDAPRPFRATVIAPAAGVTFIATLDDEPLTVVVHQDKAY